jgi:lipoate-protein ligase A
MREALREKCEGRALPVETWRLIDLGYSEPYCAQAFYEAVAKTVGSRDNPNTIIILQPATPYVCIGFHQELEREIDLGFCRSKGLPIIRRTQGGGAIYLDSNQIFYQVIARDDSEVIPADVQSIFKKILQVPVNVYRSLGLSAEYKSLNDVVVGNRKISGNGAGRLDESIILVGNIILDLDYEMMSQVLKVPSEKFKDKLSKSMREWVTSLRRELGYVPTREEVKGLLAQEFKKVLDIELLRGDPSAKERQIFSDEVYPRQRSIDWLYMPERRHRELRELRRVKVSGDINVVEVDHKARKLIRVTAELRQGFIEDVLISGDFFMMPEDSLPLLESNLHHVPAHYKEILYRVKRFYTDNSVETPDLTAEDFATAIMKAVQQ